MKRLQLSRTRWLRMLALLLSVLLYGCGGGGGDRNSGVQSGPAEPGVSVTPPTPQLPSDSVAASALQGSDAVIAEIGAVTLNSPLTIRFTLTANGVQTVAGLTSSNLRFSLTKLEANGGDAKGDHWQSYIVRAEDPVCRSNSDLTNSSNHCSTFTTATDPAAINQTDLKVQDVQASGKVALDQATTENNGTLAANGDGSWSYTFHTDMGDPALLTTVHRACIQFSLAAPVDNACIDFVPALLADSATAAMGSSLHSDFYTTYSGRRIATEATCNSCHARLALHGGGRTQIEYCVTCHNPGTSDANSEHNLDLKVLVHKLHNGRNLPGKTVDGLAYTIWGYNNSEVDFGNLSYPQSVTNCTRCHAGAEDVEFAAKQGLPAPTASLTADGHNWVTNPTLTVCTACHEKLLSNLKLDGTVPSFDHSAYTDATNCAGCHRDRGADAPGSLQANMAHRDLLAEEGTGNTLLIETVSNAGAGQLPVIEFSVRDGSGSAIDIQDANAFCASAIFDVRIPWDGATEFLNLDSGGVAASSPRLRGTKTPATVTALGGNRFSIDSATLSTVAAIPAGTDSIAVMIDTYYKADCDDASADYVRLDGVVKYVSTTGGTATARRGIVAVDKCASCHGRLFTFTQDPAVHGGRRGVNNPEICTACHNPARSGNGADSTSHDFSVMIHAVHASAMREVPYRGEFDVEALQFPGDLARCSTCHDGNTFTLPLPLTRQPMLSNTGLYSTPNGAVCSSCHDSVLAKAHMETAGGAQFDQPYVNAAAVTETCEICHGTGAAADVATVHDR